MTPTTVSLFCGAGGESLGTQLAFEQLGLDPSGFHEYALNHWNKAVEAHKRNLPGIDCRQEDIFEATADGTFGLRRIHLLTKAQRVKLIGNAVPRNTYAALVRSIIQARPEVWGREVVA